ncbi:MAG: DNA polymerase III subunit gamma/tau [Dehalococcoidales bacterium]|nr:DNA polymerase III subunit gamma/tau [Dehalococcoidales bacterium]
MASQVFYRKYRPQRFSDTLGQEHVTRTLLNALANERISHAYLFCGPRGTGKTTTARMLAKAFNCLTDGKGEPCNECEMCQAVTEGRCLDVIEVDAASNRGIDEMRDLREKVNYQPNQARRKVYIIDEVHMLTKEASNALLKTLEEPPPHVMFILATTEAHKLLPTVLSRCQRFDFHRLTQANIVVQLEIVCKSEGITAEPEALTLVAKAATGSMRDALNLLQQMHAFYGAEITLRQVQDLLGMSGDQRARELVKSIIDNDIAAGVATINNVQNDGLDLRQFNRDTVEYLRMLLLVKTGSTQSVELTAEETAELKELAARASLLQVLTTVKRFGQLDSELDTFSTLPLELAVIDCTVRTPETPAEPASRPEPAAKKPAAKAAPPPPPPAPKAENPAPPAAEKQETPKVEPAPAATPAPAAESETAAPSPEQPVADAGPGPVKPPAGEAPPAAMGSAIERIQAQWSQIINEAPGGLSKTPAAALLRSGSKPLEIKNDTIILSFKYPSHKENMEKLENQKIAEKIISNFLGRACKVQCVYEHENNHLVKAALEMGAQVIDTEEQ